MTAAAVDTETLVREVVARYADPRAGLIPILQDIQAAVGYISPQALRALERETGISANESYGVATFYTQFRFTAPGKHRIQVCNGTACHVRAAARITEELCRYLGVAVGGTTPDGEISLERVACLGCCALSPVLTVDGKVYAGVTPKKMQRILKEYGFERKAGKS